MIRCFDRTFHKLKLIQKLTFNQIKKNGQWWKHLSERADKKPEEKCLFIVFFFQQKSKQIATQVRCADVMERGTGAGTKRKRHRFPTFVDLFTISFRKNSRGIFRGSFGHLFDESNDIKSLNLRKFHKKTRQRLVERTSRDSHFVLGEIMGTQVPPVGLDAAKTTPQHPQPAIGGTDPHVTVLYEIGDSVVTWLISVKWLFWFWSFQKEEDVEYLHFL